MPICEKCNKEMTDVNFYTYKDGKKTELCKKCLTMHIDNFDDSTFLWLLEKMDVPYSAVEWNAIRDKAYAKDPTKLNGMSVFGKYLSKMKLKQWKDKTWADTEKIRAEEIKREEQKEAERKEMEALAKERFENGEITEAEYLTLISTETQHTEGIGGPARSAVTGQYEASLTANNYDPFAETNFISEQELDTSGDLTKEDQIYLAVKWGRLYKPMEWIALEKLYNDFMNSFDIQGAARIDTLKMICKTSLKMNQAIDSGDIEAYQKLSKVYDSMMKSAKFTEAQNKDQKTDDFDAVGCIVDFCEKEGGYIPRLDMTVDRDNIDVTIRDLKQYNKELFFNDPSLAQQVENYLKKKEIIEEQKKNAQEKMRTGQDSILTDADIADFYEEEQRQRQEDELTYQGGDEE